MGSSVCDRYRVGAVAGSRFDAAVSSAINGEPELKEGLSWPKTPTLYVCHGDDGARGGIRVAACRRHSVPRESSTRR
jgi:hypothetical protein